MTVELEALQSLIDAGDQPVFAVDRDLCYTAFNGAHAGAMRALYGAEITVGGRLPEYQTVATDRETALNDLGRALAGEVVTAAAFSGEGERPRSLEVVYAPQRDAGGAIVGVIAVGHDAIERRRTEAALRESEERFRLLSTNTPDSTSVQDTDLRYEWVVNPALGMTPEDFIGKTDADLVDAEQFEMVRALKQQVMDSGEPLHVEVPLTDATGAVTFYAGTYVPRRDAEGNVNGILSYFKDITKRKRAEDQLAEVLAAIEEAQVAILIADTQGRVVRVNPTCCRVLGRTADELTALTLADVDPGFALKRWPGQLEELRRPGASLDWQTERVASGGATLTLEVHVSLVKAHGRELIVAFAHDATARRRAETALAERERLLTTLLGNLPGMAYRCANDRTLLDEFVSDGCEALTGYPAAKLTRDTPFVALMDPDDVERTWRETEEAVARDEAWTYTFRITTAGGETKWVRERGVAVKDEQGNVAALEGFIQDITPQKAAEERLEAAVTEWRQTFDAMRDSVALFDAEGRVVRANAATATLTGLGQGEIEGRHCYEVFHGTDHYHEQCPQVRAFGSGHPESSLLEQDGRWLRVTFEPRIDDDGRVRGGVHVVSDVTEIVMTQRRLADSEEKFKYVFDNSPIGKSITLPTGEINVNQAFCRMLGYSRDELEHARWQDITVPEDIEATQKQIASVLSGQDDHVRFVKRYLHKSGSVVWADVATFLRRDESGGPLYFVTAVVDITERRLAEAEIHRLNAELEERVASRTAQLEAANRELESFAYSVSHDLRAPLRAIDGFTQMVVEDAAERLGADDLAHLERARAAAQRMASLIDDLLELSRVSRTELERRHVDVSALAEAIAQERREAEPGRRVDVVVMPGMWAEADPTLLRVVLSNLFDNAWKFTGRHEKARIEVGVTEAGGERVFFVKDDGAGFDAEAARHLFGAFQRYHTADRFEGNGIGLATVQRLVLRHGGRVWAEAEVEKGATFCFTLPGSAA